MKMPYALPLLGLAAGCMTEAPPTEMSAAAQMKITDALAGRVQAGPPQNCVSQRNLRGNRSAGEGAIVFRTVGSDLIYVNRPRAGCPEIRSGRAIRVRTTTSQLCSGDIVEVFDPLQNFGFGGCALGEFTPYRRPK
jgi:hypothetical protein